MAGSLNFLCGPLTSILCDRFGCRRVACAGALLSITGLFLTSLVTQLHFMYLTYGLLWGIGSSFSFVPSIVILGDYFDKRLALANGLATSGSGVGSLLASPAINYSLRVVGWKNSMRILSGAATFLLVGCFLFRPYNIRKKRDRKRVPGQCARLCDVSIWKNRTYVVYVLTVAVFQLGYQVPFVHLVSSCAYHLFDVLVCMVRSPWAPGMVCVVEKLLPWKYQMCWIGEVGGSPGQ